MTAHQGPDTGAPNQPEHDTQLPGRDSFSWREGLMEEVTSRLPVATWPPQASPRFWGCPVSLFGLPPCSPPDPAVAVRAAGKRISDAPSPTTAHWLIRPVRPTGMGEPHLPPLPDWLGGGRALSHAGECRCCESEKVGRGLGGERGVRLKSEKKCASHLQGTFRREPRWEF